MFKRHRTFCNSLRFMGGFRGLKLLKKAVSKASFTCFYRVSVSVGGNFRLRNAQSFQIAFEPL